jgi:uridine phosphorylase
LKKAIGSNGMTDNSPKELRNEYPILEYDSARGAVIEPQAVEYTRGNMPARVVLCFFGEVIETVCGDGKAEIIGYVGSREMGRKPVYRFETDGGPIAVAHPSVGAPLAANSLERAIKMGGRKFIACGGAGVLDSAIPAGHVVLPVSAVRDEGTSYHYLPPAREVAASEAAVAAIVRTLEARSVPYMMGKTWTTDAVFRETSRKVSQRRDEGCITVEMEAAAFFAVAQFRGVTFGQILYSGDDVSGEVWDNRDWVHGQASVREQLFWLAVEAVLDV